MAKRPWMTSNQLIEAVKRKISFPISQNTFSEEDILAFANEEMLISQVPSVMEFHEEFFVMPIEVALTANNSRYAIPNRAIGMKMRDLFYKDASDNLFEMTRISPDDKAYWQNGSSFDNTLTKYYVEGNDIVLAPGISGTPSGSLVFYIYLRPNQLVADERAAIATKFVKFATITGVTSGDSITINDETFVAGTDFAVGGNDIATANNIVNAINSNGVAEAVNDDADNVILIKYTDLSISIEGSDSSITIDDSQGIEFDQVPTTWTDPVTSVVEDLFIDGAEVDFLQTKPGHRTHDYDVMIPTGGIEGEIIYFDSDDVPTNFLIGDYICLAHECIIPQIPPDLHNGLAERTCARILSSMGDDAGMQATMAKIQEIETRQGTLLDNRVEGSPQKVTGRSGLLRHGKRRY